jgi:hypothetical protein
MLERHHWWSCGVRHLRRSEVVVADEIRERLVHRLGRIAVLLVLVASVCSELGVEL